MIEWLGEVLVTESIAIAMTWFATVLIFGKRLHEEEEEKEDLREDLNEEEDDLAEAESEIARQEAVIQSAQHTISRLEGRVETLEDRERDLVQQNQDLSERIATLRKEGLSEGGQPRENVEKEDPLTAEMQQFLSKIEDPEARSMVKQDIRMYRDEGLEDPEIMKRVREGGEPAWAPGL